MGAAMLLGGCGPAFVDTPGRTLPLTAGDVAVPVKSMAERRFLTVVRQRYDFSCGSAALATLLRFHYGDDASEQSVFMGMWQNGDRAQISRLGFSLLDMKRYLNAHRIRAEGYVVTLDEVARTRVPGIALIDVRGYRHFVVVKGVEGGQVLVGDPSLGIRLIDVKTFGSMWNGILFALVDAVEDGKRSFGRESEWALVARSRATMTMEPVSIQALALVRAPPFPVEL
ncbi:MAG: C39 family peptidase [Sphingomonas sp.]|uniref:C39 family peptidase n=1 Tax=Sphingomonas sp. TaxID=28214 RepID=UPI002276D955|nr:C39 family peptidase [Sphingomonas sp.]MCX8474810.1 C39 family peptidase [Sphingomonas sp.]